MIENAETASTDHHLRSLDGLRGVAVALVVLLHAGILDPSGLFGFLRVGGPFSGGFMGVDIFFVLSGFLITSRLLRDADRHGRPQLLRFWRARALRLLPAITLFLSAYIAYSILAGYPGTGSPITATSTAVSVMLFTANIKQVVDFGRYAPELGHMWSLSIEEQFYVFWPLLITGLLLWRRHNLRALLWVMVGLFIAIGIWRGVVFHDLGWRPTYVRTDTRADALIAGGVVAVTVRLGWTLGSRSRLAAWGAVVTVALVVGFVESAIERWLYYGLFSVVAVATGVLVSAIASGTRIAPWLFESAPLVLLGRVSFGVYLWHFAIFKFVDRHLGGRDSGFQLLLGLGLTAVAVAISWFLVERPAQKWRHRLDSVTPLVERGREPTGVRRVAAAVVLLGCLVLLTGVGFGRLGASTGPGATVAHYSQLRALSFLDLQGTPPSATVLSASLFNEFPSAYTSAHSVLAVIRLPVVALDDGIAPWTVTASLLFGWVVASLGLRRLAQMLSARSPNRVTGGATLIASAVSLLLAVVMTWSNADQRWEAPVWILAASAVFLVALIRVGQHPSPLRWLAATLAVVFAGLAQTYLGWFSLIALILLAGSAVFRTTPWRPGLAGALSCSLAFAVLAALPLEGRSGVAAPMGVSTGWTLPAPTVSDLLYVRGRCPELYSSVNIDAPVWESANAPASRFVLRFRRVPSTAGRGPIIRFSGAERIGVDIESDGRRIRFVGVNLDESATSRWWTVEPGVDIALTVDLVDGQHRVTFEGEDIGHVGARISGEQNDRFARVVLADLASEIGIQPSITERSSVPTELCDAVLDEVARTIQFASTLPGASTADELLAIGSCDAVVRGTGRPEAPWDVLDARPFQALVRIEPDALAGVRPIAVATSSDQIVVLVETDGNGRARFRFSVPYAPTDGDWFDIATAPEHTVRIDLAGEERTHVVTINDELLLRVPLTTVTDEGANDRLATSFWFWPAAVAAGTEVAGVQIELAQQFPPDLCMRRGESTNSVTSGTEIPFVLAPGQIYIAPRCGAMLVGDLVGDRPWDVVEVARIDASVLIESIPDSPTTATVIEVADSPRAVDVSIDVDGNGRARVVTSAPFITAASDWFEVAQRDRIDITLTTRMHEGLYAVHVGDTEVARVPIIWKEDLFESFLFNVPRLIEGRDARTGTMTTSRPTPDRAPLCSLFEQDDERP
jgi:peptidoglycan/LPS O-acetylase OafA/YrhL